MELPTDFFFLRPWWLLACLPILVLLWLLARKRLATPSSWQARIDAHLLPCLIEASPPAKRRPFRLYPLALTWLAAVIAISGPVWKQQSLPLQQKTDALVIIIDLSLSMYSVDLPPSRLERIRFKLTDLLKRRQEGLTAMIVYAGDAHVVTPLTDDTNTLINLLPALRPEIMPIWGSRVGPGLHMAIQLLDEAEASDGRIFLITDGIDQPGEFLETAARSAYPLAVLGTGTPEGGPVLLSFGGRSEHLRDAAGNPVLPGLDHESLRTLVTEAGGTYSPFTTDLQDLDTLFPIHLANMADSIENTEKQIDLWQDQGYWLLILCIPGLLFLFRKGVLYNILFTGLTLSLSSTPAAAGWWEDLWQNQDQQGHRLLTTEERPEEAVHRFADPSWKASAHYRNRNFDEAALLWSLDDSADGHFNRGNALAFAGDIMAAITAYEEALKRDPEHQDAAFNLDLLQELLGAGEQDGTNENRQRSSAGEEQQNQANQSGTQGNRDASGQPSPSPQEMADNTGLDEQTGKEGEGQQSPLPADNRQTDSPLDQDDQQASARENLTREDLQSLEQWLRRIPDDPGGLLKRKFQYETRERQRNGERTPQSEKIW